ncbi:MAG: hypothetical protein VKK04_05370 [Synechococcales bacterium]|nr:hypothetical protein [Synechococcales bacterium]
MPFFFNGSALVIPLTLHLLIGAVGAVIAYRKGRRLDRWLVLGLIAGTPALIAALVLKPQPDPRNEMDRH